MAVQFITLVNENHLLPKVGEGDGISLALFSFILIIENK